MGSRRLRGSTSPKQILVRNFNWRMGSLRRYLMCARALDPDLDRRMSEAIEEQMWRDKEAHERRLQFLETGNPDNGGYDNVLIEAKFEAERNKRALESS
jgi:hypothetical protein